MVIVLIGILAVFAVPKLGNITTTNAAAFAVKLRADIRYAQNLAMTRGRRTQVNFTTSSYAVSQDSSVSLDCSSFGAASDPATSGSLTVNLNTGNYTDITITPSMACLEYDSLGRPYVCGGGACSTNLSGMTILVNANAAAIGTVTITPQTGAVN